MKQWKNAVKVTSFIESTLQLLERLNKYGLWEAASSFYLFCLGRKQEHWIISVENAWFILSSESLRVKADE